MYSRGFPVGGTGTADTGVDAVMNMEDRIRRKNAVAKVFLGNAFIYLYPPKLDEFFPTY